MMEKSKYTLCQTIINLEDGVLVHLQLVPKGFSSEYPFSKWDDGIHKCVDAFRCKNDH